MDLRTLIALYLALREFAHQTRFMRFYHGQESFFVALEQGVRELLGNHDLISTVESYFGVQQIRYHLMLSPPLHHEGFGPHIGRPGGHYDVYTHSDRPRHSTEYPPTVRVPTC